MRPERRANENTNAATPSAPANADPVRTSAGGIVPVPAAPANTAASVTPQRARPVRRPAGTAPARSLRSNAWNSTPATLSAAPTRHPSATRGMRCETMFSTCGASVSPVTNRHTSDAPTSAGPKHSPTSMQRNDEDPGREPAHHGALASVPGGRVPCEALVRDGAGPARHTRPPAQQVVRAKRADLGLARRQAPLASAWRNGRAWKQRRSGSSPACGSGRALRRTHPTQCGRSQATFTQPQMRKRSSSSAPGPSTLSGSHCATRSTRCGGVTTRAPISARKRRRVGTQTLRGAAGGVGPHDPGEHVERRQQVRERAARLQRQHGGQPVGHGRQRGAEVRAVHEDQIGLQREDALDVQRIHADLRNRGSAFGEVAVLRDADEVPEPVQLGPHLGDARQQAHDALGAATERERACRRH